MSISRPTIKDIQASINQDKRDEEYLKIEQERYLVLKRKLEAAKEQCSTTLDIFKKAEGKLLLMESERQKRMLNPDDEQAAKENRGSLIVVDDKRIQAAQKRAEKLFKQAEENLKDKSYKVVDAEKYFKQCEKDVERLKK